MKRLLSLLMVMLFAFSSIFVMNVSASEISTADEVSESDIEMQIKEALTSDDGIASGSPLDCITVYGLITLSDGSVLFNFEADFGWVDVIADFEIGPYEYFVDYGSQKYIYINSKVYRIADAYDEGLISDSLLDEIADVLGLVNTKQIKEALIRTKLPDVTPDQISISYDRLTILSDGSVLFRYNYLGEGHSSISHEVEIGNYRYEENVGYEYNIFINSDVYILKDAYDEGLISDSLLDEIAEALDFEEIEVVTEPATEPATESVTEPVTETVTESVAESVTEAVTESEKELTAQPTDVSTDDEVYVQPTTVGASTNDEAEAQLNSTDGDNTAVATGQSGLFVSAVVILLMMIFAVCSLRKKSKFE